MGFFYIGAKTNNYKNGYMKIGETNQKYLSSRIAQIRKKQGNFVVLAYLEIPESTSAMTRAIESYVRFKLEQHGYEMVQNDHFVFPISADTKDAQFSQFTALAIGAACHFCEMEHIAYQVKTDKTNLKHNVKTKK